MNFVLNCVHWILAKPDNITPFLLKNIADFIFIPFCNLFNKPLQTGTLPFNWVSGNVVPVHKCNHNITLVTISQLALHLYF